MIIFFLILWHTLKSYLLRKQENITHSLLKMNAFHDKPVQRFIILSSTKIITTSMIKELINSLLQAA